VFLVPVLILCWLQLECRPAGDGKPPPEHWQAIATVVPENAQVHYNLAASFEQQGNLAEAAGEYRRALAIKADYDKAHFNLAGVLSRLGMPDDAASHYEAAIRLRPGYASACNNLGAVRLQQRDFARAISAFQQAVALEPRNPGFAANLAQAHFHLAQQLARAGKRDEAADHCREAARVNPGDPILAPQIEELRQRLNAGES
jgi:tetratricopeptide (TPR) repeat protein